MSDLVFYLFGSVRVELAGQEIPMRPASRALLLYLLLYRARYHRREVLSALFWGDSDDTRARRCLNSALWRLRQELNDNNRIGNNLQGDVGIELLNQDRLDVAEFEDMVLPDLKKPPTVLTPATIKQLEQATALYQGDLAENCFYDWVLPERERLRALYLDVLTLVMHAYTAQQAHGPAIATAQQLLVTDPLREDVHRQLIRLYIATGQRSRALQQYMTCWQVLRDELHLTPMPETTALYEQMMGPEPFLGETAVPAFTPTLSTAPPPPNLSRLKELLYHLQAEIQHTLHALQTNHPDGRPR